MKTLELTGKLNLNEERLYDANLQKCLSELENIVEDLTGDPKPGSRPGSLKRKASQYLGKGAGDTLSKSELANKMKKSSKKEERDRGIQLARQVSFAFNMRN